MKERVASLWIKVCGVTTVEDALLVKASGADAIGLNFAPASPRCISKERTREIAEALGGGIELVGVFVNMPIDELRQIVAAGLTSVQLHGTETPEELTALRGQGIEAYKALRIGGVSDVEAAGSFPGERILVDAKVKGAMGGTGHTFDWSLIEQLNKQRQMILAGGLKPSNVAAAVAEVRPYGIDTASGVESAPGVKDEAMVRAFVRAAREA